MWSANQLTKSTANKSSIYVLPFCEINHMGPQKLSLIWMHQDTWLAWIAVWFSLVGWEMTNQSKHLRLLTDNPRKQVVLRFQSEINQLRLPSRLLLIASSVTHHIHPSLHHWLLSTCTLQLLWLQTSLRQIQ